MERRWSEIVNPVLHWIPLDFVHVKLSVQKQVYLKQGTDIFHDNLNVNSPARTSEYQHDENYNQSIAGATWHCRKTFRQWQRCFKFESYAALGCEIIEEIHTPEQSNSMA